MDYNLAILHENTVKMKIKVSLSYKQGRSGTFSGRGGGFSKKFRNLFLRLTKLIL